MRFCSATVLAVGTALVSATAVGAVAEQCLFCVHDYQCSTCPQPTYQGICMTDLSFLLGESCFTLMQYIAVGTDARVTVTSDWLTRS
ncbi:uncharacterized protein EDB93DRAFT_1137534 [Suillus bovinus]|uniref:uncharacterized protein n=1 Tax=Suillus bovinus TaxID=48563 RepID=UPI001B85C392|nr:uncharacterized protein EDB93DRAFT_1137534 [Suillus bovinus]KAG2152602.1 hypothetical protein EDB93DRAFT_1137534 [Suillus bovinus]